MICFITDYNAVNSSKIKISKPHLIQCISIKVILDKFIISLFKPKVIQNKLMLRNYKSWFPHSQEIFTLWNVGNSMKPLLLFVYHHHLYSCLCLQCSQLGLYFVYTLCWVLRLKVNDSYFLKRPSSWHNTTKLALTDLTAYLTII